MQNVNILYDHLRQHVPFAFSKFNDGEHVLLSPNSCASRGQQDTSDLMRIKLFETLIWKHEKYYLGLPCNFCYPEMRRIDEWIRGNDDPFFPANVLINSNIKSTIDVLKEVLPTYAKVVIVASEAAKVERIEQYFGIKFYDIIRTRNKNAFDASYAELNGKRFDDGTLVLLCCGPLGRVLVYEWFKANPNLTCLELGSMFDPLTQNKAYMYHYGGVRKCPECNPWISESVFTDEMHADTFLDHYYYIPIASHCMPYESLAFYFDIKQMHFEREWLEFNHCKDKQTDEWLKSMHDKYPDRTEPGFLLFERTKNFEVLQQLFERLPRGRTNEFSDGDIYSWKVSLAMSIEAWYHGRKDLGQAACSKLICSQNIPDHVRASAEYNIRWYS